MFFIFSTTPFHIHRYIVHNYCVDFMKGSTKSLLKTNLRGFLKMLIYTSFIVFSFTNAIIAGVIEIAIITIKTTEKLSVTKGKFPKI